MFSHLVSLEANLALLFSPHHLDNHSQQILLQLNLYQVLASQMEVFLGSEIQITVNLNSDEVEEKMRAYSKCQGNDISD